MIVRNDAELLEILDHYRSLNKVAFTCGVFDVLHYEHHKHLGNIRSLCLPDNSDEGLVIIVAVNTDASVLHNRGRLPHIEESQRIFQVDDLQEIDIVIPMPDSHPSRLIEIIRPNFYVKGPDYSDFTKLPEWPILEQLGTVCISDKTTGNIRSTDLRLRGIDDRSI